MALQMETLERSFDLVAPRGDELVDRFYTQLFETAPHTRPLFAQTDMATQKQALLATLITVRESLRDLPSVVPDLQELGARHAGYGVRPEDYPIVGRVLLDTMAELGGANWRPEYTAAWAEAYQVVQDTMLSGAGAAASAGS